MKKNLVSILLVISVLACSDEEGSQPVIDQGEVIHSGFGSAQTIELWDEPGHDLYSTDRFNLTLFRNVRVDYRAVSITDSANVWLSIWVDEGPPYGDTFLSGMVHRTEEFFSVTINDYDLSMNVESARFILEVRTGRGRFSDLTVTAWRK